MNVSRLAELTPHLETKSEASGAVHNSQTLINK